MIKLKQNKTNKCRSFLVHFFTCGQAEIACTKSRDKSASRGVSNSKREERGVRERGARVSL